ncbi:hypothetical protein OC834_001178 [Tilletia horrida]|nr:hypothetical protein OC834_001178 [Tilletia horrida]
MEDVRFKLEAPRAMPSDLLAVLPPELVFDIFARLDPVSLARCSQVSTGWRKVVADDLLWRRVAFRVLNLPPNIEKDDLNNLPEIQRWSASTHFHELQSFRDLCARWTQVLHGWCGGSKGADGSGKKDELAHSNVTEGESDEKQAEASTVSLTQETSSPGHQPQDAVERPDSISRRQLKASTKLLRAVLPEGEPDLWRIKVDPEEGTLIATTRSGGLFVIDIEANRIVWQVGPHQVGPYTHLEGERGILVVNGRLLFDESESFNVWVHKRLLPDGGDGELYQIRSKLRLPSFGRASRFKWPIFCAMDSTCTAHFYDLTDPDSPQKLDSIDASARYGEREIRYIDFDDNHFFIVGAYADQVTVFERSTGKVKWSMASYLRHPEVRDLIRSYQIETTRSQDLSPFGFPLPEAELMPRALDSEWEFALADILNPIDYRRDSFEWHAIHPDEATGALFVLGEPVLLIIPNFASLTDAACKVPIMAIHYQGPTLGRGRLDQVPLCVADGRAFLVQSNFILLDLMPDREGMLTSTSTSSPSFSLPPNPTTPPNIRLFAGPHEHHHLADLHEYAGCSCAQMDGANVFAVVATEAPLYGDAEEEMDAREAIFEALHFRVGPRELLRG